MGKFDVNDLVEPSAQALMGGVLKAHHIYRIMAVDWDVVQLEGIPGWFGENSFDLHKKAPRVLGPQSDQYLAGLKYAEGDVVEVVNDEIEAFFGKEGVIAQVGAPNGDDYVVRFPKAKGIHRSFNEPSLRRAEDNLAMIEKKVQSLASATAMMVQSLTRLATEIEHLAEDVAKYKEKRS